MNPTAAYYSIHGTLAQKLVLAKLMKVDGMIYQEQVILLAMLLITGETEEIRQAALRAMQDYEVIVNNEVTTAACDRVREIYDEVGALSDLQHNPAYGR